jgi:hypothetical protein
MSNEHIMELFGVDEWDSVLAEFREGGRLEGRWGFLKMLTKLKEPGRFFNYPVEMARLYGGAGKRWSSMYAIPGDQRLMTVSAGKIDGQWTLLQHLDDGSTRPVSVFEVGQRGDIWIGGDGQNWGGQHGYMTGEPGTHIYTLAPDEFDRWGARLDIIGIVGDASASPTPVGIVGKGVAILSDVSSAWRSAIRMVQARKAGASSSELWALGFDFALDGLGCTFDYWPDVLSLITNYGSSVRIDRVE